MEASLVKLYNRKYFPRNEVTSWTTPLYTCTIYSILRMHRISYISHVSNEANGLLFANQILEIWKPFSSETNLLE